MITANNLDYLDGFSPKQIQCIFSLAQGLNYSQTCRSQGISRNCLWLWRKNPKFREAIEIQKNIFINKMTTDAFDLRADANQLLQEKLNSGDKEEAVKIAFSVLMCLGVGREKYSQNKKAFSQIFG
jgi:hypothetical protein